MGLHRSNLIEKLHDVLVELSLNEKFKLREVKIFEQVLNKVLEFVFGFYDPDFSEVNLIQEVSNIYIVV
jgi:hypothetical protein